MNCPKCGQELSDRSAFCPNCGMAILRKEEAPEQIPAAEPVVEAPAEVQVPEVSVQEAVAEVPKKKNFWQKFRLPICIGVPAVAVILLVAFNLNWIVGTFLKTFAKPETYYAHVEEETFTDLTENISKLYGAVTGTGEKSKDTATSAKANIKVSVGKDALSLLNQASGQDLSWLSEINLGVDANVDGDLMEATYDIGLKGGKIVSAHLVMDLANMKAWVGIPDLNPTYLEIDIMNLALGGVSSDAVAMMPSYGYAMPAVSAKSVADGSSDMPMVYDILMDVMENGAEFLPSEDEMNKLLDRYVKVALDAITDVEKGSKDLSVGGVKQKVTTLEVDFSEETLLDVLTAVLNEAKDDEDLKAIVEKAEKYIEKEYLNGEDTGLSKMLDEAIDTYLDQLGDVDASSETVLTMTSYINGSHEIIGREFSSGDQDILFYAKVNKGSKFGFELAVNGETLVEGSGKESGGKMTGTFEVGMQDVEICEIEVEEFDLDSLKEGYLNGTFRIKPSEALMEQFDLPSFLSSDLALELVFASSEEKVDFAVKLLMGGKNFVSVEISSEATDGGSVSKPSNVIDADSADEDEMMEWVGNVDFEKLLKNAKSAGVPDELVSQLENMLEDTLG